MWRSAGLGQGRASAYLDGSMFVIDNQARSTCADRTHGSALFIAICNFQFAEIRLHFAAARARLYLEASFFWKINLHVAAAIVHLDATQFAHVDFNRAILILQTQIAFKPLRRISFERVNMRNGPMTSAARKS